MITIKNKAAIAKMEEAGKRLASIFEEIPSIITENMSTLAIDMWIEKKQNECDLISKSKGYKGYKHVSCISMNDEIVHGVPRADRFLREGDLIKIDVCASWNGYCADMARMYVVGVIDEYPEKKKLIDVAQAALDQGIAKAYAGNRLSDISAAIQKVVEHEGFGVVRDFAGHGIGKMMHEDPEILNFGQPGRGPLLQAGMALALEPMITMGLYKTVISDDGWTAKTADESLAAHVEDTIIITNAEPKIITRCTVSRE